MSDALELHQGQEKVFPVSIYDEETGIPNALSGCTITVQLLWRDKLRRTLAVGDGVEILDLSPTPPVSGEDPSPQFQWRLTEERSREFPEGQISHANYVLVDGASVTTIYGPIPIRVLSP